MTADRNAIALEIRRFVEDRCFADDEAVDPACDLFWSGRLSSSDLIELIMFIEERFAIRVDPTKVVVEKLGTIDSIAETFSKLATMERP